MIFTSILVVTGIAVVLCGLALPIWILGIPGIDNDYARGWNLGLSVILTYPITWMVIYIPYFVVCSRLSERSLQRWQIAISAIAAGSLLVAIARMVHAFRIMQTV